MSPERLRALDRDLAQGVNAVWSVNRPQIEVAMMFSPFKNFNLGLDCVRAITKVDPLDFKFTSSQNMVPTFGEMSTQDHELAIFGALSGVNSTLWTKGISTLNKSYSLMNHEAFERGLDAYDKWSNAGGIGRGLFLLSK